MFVLTTAILVTSAVVVRLVGIVAGDRPSTPPRSHDHELDRHTARVV